MTRKGGLLTRRNRMGYVYILPWIIGFTAFQAFPILYSFYISLHKWDMLSKPKLIGWANYQSLLNDPRFIISIRNTFLFMLFSMGLGISLGLFIAALLAENLKGNRFYRTVFYLPNLVVPVAFGMMMRPIFGGFDYGLINIVLSLFGFEGVRWLDNPATAIWVVIITNFWFIGACMIIFLAGIKSISRTYYEAAEIDGAGWFRRLFNITIPLLGPILFFQTITGLIYALQIFDIPVAMGNLGGSQHTTMGINDSLGTLIYYLYLLGFRNWNMGKASAVGWVVFGIGLVFTFIILKVLKRSWKTQEANQI
jgi:multiple sugar transport system permease protein